MAREIKHELPSCNGVPPGTCGGRGRRERKTAETRERIYRAAIDLFAERGVCCVTVEQITDRADVGKGTFFNYFPSKEAVLVHFGGTQVERLRQAVDRGEIRGTAREKLHAALQLLAAHPDLTQELARGLFSSALNGTSFMEQEGPHIWQLTDLIAAIFAEGQARGEFRPDCEPPAAAQFVLGLYFLAQLDWCVGFSSEPLPEIVTRALETGLRGLEARP